MRETVSGVARQTKMRLSATYSLIELLLCFIFLVVFVSPPVLLSIRHGV